MRQLVLIGALSVMSLGLFGQTQLELNKRARAEFVKADKELNFFYQKLLRDYKNDTVFIKNAKEAQRQWLKFRDAQLKMKFPYDKTTTGSVLPMCQDYYLEELTIKRIEELKQWIDGVEEGDVCSGSVRLKR